MPTYLFKKPIDWFRWIDTVYQCFYCCPASIDYDWTLTIHSFVRRAFTYIRHYRESLYSLSIFVCKLDMLLHAEKRTSFIIHRHNFNFMCEFIGWMVITLFGIKSFSNKNGPYVTHRMQRCLFAWHIFHHNETFSFGICVIINGKTISVYSLPRDRKKKGEMMSIVDSRE